MSGCALLSVRVTRKDGQFHLTVRDPMGNDASHILADRITVKLLDSFAVIDWRYSFENGNSRDWVEGTIYTPFVYLMCSDICPIDLRHAGDMSRINTKQRQTKMEEFDEDRQQTDAREDSRMITSGMMSSMTDKWATPWYFFRALDREFHFTLDVCADADNRKVDRYFDESTDGLAQDWTKDICWMNPPYGRVIDKWMAKAAETGRNGGIVVCLVPARTDTRWWREYAMQASEIRLVSGRIKFGDSGQGAPFPSAVVIFGTPTTPRLVQWEVKGDE